MTKILFTKAHALCHDINKVTKTSNHIDIVMGFSTGDIIWYEPMSQKYARINKNVRTTPSTASSRGLLSRPVATALKDNAKCGRAEVGGGEHQGLVYRIDC